MIQISDLLDVAQAYRAAIGMDRESTLSHRLFGDTKILARLHQGGEITVGRFNTAMTWFAEHWPADVPAPPPLAPYKAATPQKSKDAA